MLKVDVTKVLISFNGNVRNFQLEKRTNNLSAHGGANQKWKLHKDGTIRLEGHDLCLDIQGGSKDKGAHLVAWPHHGGSNQKWRIVTKWH